MLDEANNGRRGRGVTGLLAFFVIMIANILTICNTEILNYVQ